MRKAGKIIAAIFASICIVASLITVVVAIGAKGAQDDPEAFKKSMREVSANASETEPDEATKIVQDYFLNLNHEKVLSQGIVGAILSIVILVTVLINVPSMPIITPAIASIASLGGAIYCGWVIMMFMVITLIGSGLVLLC